MQASVGFGGFERPELCGNLWKTPKMLLKTMKRQASGDRQAKKVAACRATPSLV